ncbi:MAG: HXXEE domain-containing protein [Agathobacter sp.]|nr:HXXEE domain-containing protein [Agathobacter sp.]
MIKFIIKYGLEILTVIMFILITALAVFFPDASIVRKFLAVYMCLFTLHEWEENKYPGGFSNLMKKTMGLEFNKDAEARSHLPVYILLLGILIIPFIFDSIIILSLIPMSLGIFECIVHIVGIKLHKMDKPYTPGLITAICMLITSVYMLYYYNTNHIATGTDYLYGALLTFVSFAIMQNRVLASLGYGYKDIFENVKHKFKK